jgi:hypothetical protein
MKSRQLNFFLTQADQERLIKTLLEIEDFSIVESIALGKLPKILESASIKEMGNERLKVFLLNNGDMKNLVLTEYPNQPYKFVDVVRSPAIEFVRCYVEENIIRRGRFYFVKEYIDNGVPKKKPDPFLEWGNQLLKLCRMHLIQSADNLVYLGPEALKLKERGWHLVQV